MQNTIYTHTLSNGLTLLAERMEHVRSAAVYFLMPAGCANDPDEAPGLASALAEMLTRGAGERDAEELTLALDALGVDRNEGPGLLNLFVSGNTLARNLPATLEIFADIIRRPRLPASDLEAVQALLLQDLQSLEDSPQEQVGIELQRRYYPPPLNKSRYGTAEGIAAITRDRLWAFHQRHFRPNGTILSVAGLIDWSQLRDQVEQLFGDWQPVDVPPLQPAPNHQPCSGHVPKDKQQTQITLAFPSVPVTHPQYFAARGAVGVLSNGMSSRLFTEVREKRGLCYGVSASYEGLKDRGTILGASGTRPDRAQETLDVMLAEFRKLREGVDRDEIERTQIGLKTTLIMQQESTRARAGAIASDWYYLGRVRTFDEIQQQIESLTPRGVQEYVEAYPLEHPTIVTLGPAPLNWS